MRYVVSLSGGLSSAVAADRLIERVGRDAVLLWFADTAWEDDDLYRFVDDCMVRWGGDLTRYKDGRTPLEVFEWKKIIPNSMIAPCTFVLKIEPFRRYLATLDGPITVAIGYDWNEGSRRERTESEYAKLGYACEFPLLWKPLEYGPLRDVVKAWGVEPPRLYGLGFPHNNCGGRCIRQGKREWLRLRDAFPARFAEVRDWEQAQRAKGGPRANRAIVRDKEGKKSIPLPLADLERRQEVIEAEMGDDLFSCYCASA